VRHAGDMAREIPEVVRAVAGLAATVLDEARKLPETLTGLPVRLIGQALQASLRLQQHYSGLVARGDEVFTGLRGDAEPGLATFDEDLPAAPSNGAGPHTSAFDRVGELTDDTLVEELAEELAEDEVEAEELAEELVAAQELAEDLAVVEELAEELAVAALEDAAEELVDLGGPEAAESVSPDSPITDSAASEPLVAPVTPEGPDGAAATGGEDTAGADTADTAETTEDTQSTESAGSAEPASPTSPVEGYDAFSIPALRGRLRAYPLETVADLLDYERATEARAPYVTLLQNRLEKLSADRG
jgi:hypothetical protein